MENNMKTCFASQAQCRSLPHSKLCAHSKAMNHASQTQGRSRQQSSTTCESRQSLCIESIVNSNHLSAIAPLALVACSCLISGEASAAVHAEPANALSIPTWIIHVSSVIEWTSAMFLMWRFAEVTGNPRWKGMTWGMIPLFTGALCACTFHFFYNSPELEFLVPIQAGLTWVGNATLWIAAYRIYEASETGQEDKKKAS